MIRRHCMTTILVDFFPVLLFFAAYKVWGLMTATAVLIVATMAQVAWSWMRRRRVNRMHIVTAGLVLVFGGITLLLNDELFIKWKPTVVNWLFAMAFIGSHLFGDRVLIRRIMEPGIRMRDTDWFRLNLAWVAFFVLLGTLNLWVVYAFSTDAWVNFKLFGMLGLTILFALAQGFWMAQRVIEPSRPERIEQALRAAFTDAEVSVRDDSHMHVGHAGARDGRGHFFVTVVTADFAGRPVLERHRMVYDALSDMLTTDIHALSIDAQSPKET